MFDMASVAVGGDGNDSSENTKAVGLESAKLSTA